jgi:hypothetical protein
MSYKILVVLISIFAAKHSLVGSVGDKRIMPGSLIFQGGAQTKMYIHNVQPIDHPEQSI